MKKSKQTDLQIFISKFDFNHKLLSNGAEFRVKDIDTCVSLARNIISEYDLNLVVVQTGLMASRGAFEIKEVQNG